MHRNGSLGFESYSLDKDMVEEQGVEKPGNADKALFALPLLYKPQKVQYRC